MRNFPSYSCSSLLLIPLYPYELTQCLSLQPKYCTNEHLLLLDYPSSSSNTFLQPFFEIQFFHISPLQNQLSISHSLHPNYPYKISDQAILTLYLEIYTIRSSIPIINILKIHNDNIITFAAE